MSSNAPLVVVLNSIRFQEHGEKSDILKKIGTIDGLDVRSSDHEIGCDIMLGPFKADGTPSAVCVLFPAIECLLTFARSRLTKQFQEAKKKFGTCSAIFVGPLEDRGLNNAQTSRALQLLTADLSSLKNSSGSFSAMPLCALTPNTSILFQLLSQIALMHSNNDAADKNTRQLLQNALMRSSRPDIVLEQTLATRIAKEEAAIITSMLSQLGHDLRTIGTRIQELLDEAPFNRDMIAMLGDMFTHQ